ncbi:LptA/OstA family protein [Sporomusa termitida]|uniref:LPS-assembly protein LptD n=1 Tax=Sporomusa termitida TaxID=2377 RepID=A0A517DZ59_9FIRM|nr:LptA/OstA family protein [Sporomusa termitida]QDR82633.1 LPS-assembly protein LptD [Sporomusa termitida]
MNRNVLFLFIIAFYFLVCSAGPAAAAKPTVTADTTYYDTDTGLYLLKGNVRIEAGSRMITAGQARVSLSSLEVWGSDGITLTQDNIHLTAGSVYAYGTQNKAVLGGGVTLSQSHITITADTADFNWRTKIGTFTGNVQVTQGSNTWSAASVTYNLRNGRLE